MLHAQKEVLDLQMFEEVGELRRALQLECILGVENMQRLLIDRFADAQEGSRSGRRRFPLSCLPVEDLHCECQWG